MNLQELTIHQQRAFLRRKRTKSAIEVFDLFFELGFRSKTQVWMQLVIHFPKYNTESLYNQFTGVWNLVRQDDAMVSDLEKVIDKINSK